MTEAMRARFLCFMTAVDDDLLEEALTVPARKAVQWQKALATIAACLCVVVGLLLWKPWVTTPTQPLVTVEELAGHGYHLPIPADAVNIVYALIDRDDGQKMAQAEFDRGGHAVTLRALITEEPAEIFEGEVWTDELRWTANGTALTLRSNGQTAQVSWYSDKIQWAVRGEKITPAYLLDTVDAILSALGNQLSHAPAGAADVHYNAFHLGDMAVGETSFTLDGVRCAYRIAVTYEVSRDFADISGVDGDFANHKETEVGWCPARMSWNEGGAGKLEWFDVVASQIFSLTMDSGAGEQAMMDLANTLFAPAQGEVP